MPENTWETLQVLVPLANVAGELISGDENDVEGPVGYGNIIVKNNYPNRL